MTASLTEVTQSNYFTAMLDNIGELLEQNSYAIPVRHINADDDSVPIILYDLSFDRLANGLYTNVQVQINLIHTDIKSVYEVTQDIFNIFNDSVLILKKYNMYLSTEDINAIPDIVYRDNKDYPAETIFVNIFFN
ncbi:MAG: hypothetical protein EOL97_09625 [Spirochaetia bacterium]|nr:hypothetical protein [Spirochaetia bacterium]